jgi:hypothetical protein
MSFQIKLTHKLLQPDFQEEQSVSSEKKVDPKKEKKDTKEKEKKVESNSSELGMRIRTVASAQADHF